jgi:citronellol/citronellal dehydrogenase
MVVFITGAARGIGAETARRLAARGAKVVLVGLESDALEAVARSCGPDALAVEADVTDSAALDAAVEQAVERFGGIDVCVNNASAIDLSPAGDLAMKRYDLMQDINERGTFVVTTACMPHLKQGTNPHVLTLSPPLTLAPRWLAPFTAYMLAKYGMTLCALGFAAHLREDGVASNTLWPRTLIATAAVQNLLGGDEAMRRSRRPELYADAAYAVITRPSRECTGNTFLCEDVLKEEGVTDMDRYAYVPGSEPQVDLFVDHV